MDFSKGMQVEIGFLSATLASGSATPRAYLDPGSGSYLLQLLIASVMGRAGDSAHVLVAGDRVRPTVLMGVSALW
jgi:hypothetical protein